MRDAEYTQYFNDWCNATTSETSTSTWLQSLQGDLTDLTSSDIALKLIAMLRALYDYWEICDEDPLAFYNLLMHKIRAYSDYYIELLNAYNTEIDFLDGKKSTVTREGSGSGDTETSNNNSSTNKDYLLPNKTINSGKGNLSQQSEGTSDSSGNSSSSNEYEETVTMTGDVDVVDAKKRYLTLIRNLYYEWAKKCEDCFLGIF